MSVMFTTCEQSDPIIPEVAYTIKADAVSETVGVMVNVTFIFSYFYDYRPVVQVCVSFLEKRQKWQVVVRLSKDGGYPREN